MEQELEQKEKEEKTLELPQSKDGIKLSWTRKKEHYFIKLALFEGLILGLLYLLQFEKKQEKRKELERQLLGEYPGFVGKFTVLVGAGMTVSAAFTRMVEQAQRSEEKRLSYMELAAALQRIREGESERVAYQKFADAMGLPEYRRFIRLLLQQMKKGGSGFLEEIRYESELAYRNHRNQVRRIGEEAGTKMLFPMILMLGIVMIIVLMPALMTFEI